MRGKTFGSFVVAGLVGAAALEGAHQLLVAFRGSSAPRLDLLGEDMVRRLYRSAGERPPSHDRLRAIAFAGSMLLDGTLLGMVTRGNPRAPWLRGVGLGALMALTANRFPRLLGARSSTARRVRSAPLATLALYALGGMVAAAVTRTAARRGDDRVLYEAKRKAMEVVRAAEHAVH
jgi:hypothetical protein